FYTMATIGDDLTQPRGARQPAYTIVHGGDFANASAVSDQVVWIAKTLIGVLKRSQCVIARHGGVCHQEPIVLMASSMAVSLSRINAVTCSKVRCSWMRRIISRTGLTLDSSRKPCATPTFGWST